MISICIPVFNYDITKLVTVLAEQMENLDESVELIVIDDCSEEIYKSKNKKRLQDHTYIELPENIGRSRIRNLFTQYAKNQYLLFLDCDSMVCSDLFLENYINALQKNIVVYGGRVYPEILPHKNQKMSWKYGKKIESKSSSERTKKPYISFMTNNFLIDKNIFKKVSFKEKITGYGHEDTLFGYELYQLKIKIIHIENTVLNMDLESSYKFMMKTDESLKNLKKICLDLNSNSGFYEYVRLLKFYKKTTGIQRNLIRFWFKILGDSLRKLFVKNLYSSWLLNFYKIGYFVSIDNK